MSSNCAGAVVEAFVRLHEKELIYQGIAYSLFKLKYKEVESCWWTTGQVIIDSLCNKILYFVPYKLLYLFHFWLLDTKWRWKEIGDS